MQITVASRSWQAILVLIGVALASTARANVRVVDGHYKLVTVVKDTTFAGANGATIGGDGALYVVHTGDGTTTRIDLKTMAATEFVHPWAGVFISDDITNDGKGTFYSTGTTPLVGEVYRIDAAGMKTVIARGLTAPNGIQFNRKTGRLFVTECFQANRVFEIDPTGAKEPRLIVKADAIPVPEGFDFDPDTADLIIPDMGTGRILRVNPESGAFQPIAEKFTAPIALKVGPDKKAYFPELGGAVYRLSLDGTIREKLAQLPPGLDNLAITPDGRLFITSYWDATVYEVATDGSGKFKTLFPKGADTLRGVLVKNGQVLVSDAIMIRTAGKGEYAPTRLNAWASHGMPLTLGLIDGPGDQILWPDAVNNAIAIGNPADGTFKPVAGGLNRPVAVVMSTKEPRLYVAEYGAGQVTEVSLTDGAKRPLVTGLDGPIALAIVDDALYIAEARTARIRKAPLSGGKSEVFLSSEVGKVGALAADGHGGLLALDVIGRRLLRIDPKKLAITTLADGLPVRYGVVGSGAASVEFPAPMHVTADGDIYLGTEGRGVIEIKATK
ncbi:MAG TPA: SMP-30/gluconolactonase/LRE family protein [Kofleriaceae bacterium]